MIKKKRNIIMTVILLVGLFLMGSPHVLASNSNVLTHQQSTSKLLLDPSGPYGK